MIMEEEPQTFKNAWQEMILKEFNGMKYEGRCVRVLCVHKKMGIQNQAQWCVPGKIGGM